MQRRKNSQALRVGTPLPLLRGNPPAPISPRFSKPGANRAQVLLTPPARDAERRLARYPAERGDEKAKQPTSAAKKSWTDAP